MPIPGHVVDDFVNEEGETVQHSVAVRCPCQDEKGVPSPNCELHEMGGWLFDEPVSIVGLVTAISNHKDWIEAGVAHPSDCVFSPLTTDTISVGDKITFPWDIPTGAGDALRRGSEDADTLYYNASKGIFCIDEERVKYKEGIDYLLSEKQIIWKWVGKPPEGISPMFGVKYSLKYMGHVEWIALDPPATRISHGEDLGSRVLLRRKHLMG